VAVAITIIYILCLLTSATCAFLLVRRYLANRTRLLLYSAICFVFLAANNLFVVLDLLIFPDVDFVPWRQVTGLAGITVLLFGFIWETE
jgi:hypothetical protein